MTARVAHPAWLGIVAELGTLACAVVAGTETGSSTVHLRAIQAAVDTAALCVVLLTHPPAQRAARRPRPRTAVDVHLALVLVLMAVSAWAVHDWHLAMRHPQAPRHATVALIALSMSATWHCYALCTALRRKSPPDAIRQTGSLTGPVPAEPPRITMVLLWVSALSAVAAWGAVVAAITVWSGFDATGCLLVAAAALVTAVAFARGMPTLLPLRVTAPRGPHTRIAAALLAEPRILAVRDVQAIPEHPGLLVTARIVVPWYCTAAEIRDTIASAHSRIRAVTPHARTIVLHLDPG